MTGTITLVRYIDVATDAGVDAALDAIFYEASNTKWFASDAERQAFRQRWLGRYLEHDAAYATLAFAASKEIIGYVVGAVDDPAVAPRFADIGYFANFGALTKLYPAHLHVNVAPQFRDRGVGASLVRRFMADVRAARAPGIHVVTGSAARNISFYGSLGFAEAGRLGKGAKEVVLLARTL